MRFAMVLIIKKTFLLITFKISYKTLGGQNRRKYSIIAKFIVRKTTIKSRKEKNEKKVTAS